jgi:hypothetical protein
MNSIRTNGLAFGGFEGPSHLDPKAAQARARTAEDISAKALEMAKLARAAGLGPLGQLLETVAMSAAADGVAATWPGEGT